MIDINVLSKYQQRLLNINSSEYKFNILTQSINYINTLVNNGEFDFLSISDDVDVIYTNNNYFYDFLENRLTTKSIDNKGYSGYNRLNIEALLDKIIKVNPSYIIHDEMYLNLNTIYEKFFSNLSEFSIYSLFHNNFKVDTLKLSNYLKTCFDKESINYDYKIAEFYIAPMYDFSKICTSQILTSIKKHSYFKIINDFSNNILYLTDISELNEKLSTFIIKNIFNNHNFNDSYQSVVVNSVKIDKLLTLFNEYVSTLSKNNILKAINNIYYDFIQEYSYVLMTIGREREIIKFNTPDNLYTKLIFAVQETEIKENQYIINLFKNKTIPQILFSVNDNVYFVKINNYEFKISKQLTLQTFNYITNILNNEHPNKYELDVQYVYNYYNQIYNNPPIVQNYNGLQFNRFDLQKKVEITQFFTPIDELIVTEKNSIYKTLNTDIIKRMDDLKSIVMVTYNYRNEPLQFINSTLAVFSDWTDLILDTQYDNIDYINTFNNSDISEIIKSIEFDNNKLVEFINTEFMDYYTNSKVIELNFYRYFGELVDGFIKTAKFKDFIINEFIEPIAVALKTRSPKLYREIYQNIDNVINYIKFLLIQKLYNSLDLQSKYRDIVKDTIISNFDNIMLSDLIDRFRILDSVSFDRYRRDTIKFVTSMAVLFLLDKYIDGFRLIKKFTTFDILKVTTNQNVVRVELVEPHNLNRGRGVVIANNTGNINGYKIIYEILSPTSFSFIQDNPKPGLGGTIDIRKYKLFNILNAYLDDDEVVITVDGKHELIRGEIVNILYNSGNINGNKMISTILSDNVFCFIQSNANPISDGMVEILF